MAEDWEDWEDESFEPPIKAPTANGSFETKGAAVLASIAEPDASKFAGEDEDDDEPTSRHQAPKPQKPKSNKKKNYDGSGAAIDDTPLDDPVAEKLRQQRLIEESDFKATQALFGGQGVDLNSMLPKSAADFEKFAEALCNLHLKPHSTSPHYKLLVKHVVRNALASMTAQETKDVETSVAGIRSEKLKKEAADKAEKAAKSKKKALNVGRSGGSAGLDDYTYEDPLDDDYDFM